MRSLLELSGMVTIVIGVAVAVVGIVVLIATEDSWVLYAAGYTISALGLIILFWIALRDRLRERRHEDLDDVGFN